MSKELKPCPFCGDSDPFVERMEISVFAVRCNSCLATGECGEDMDHDEAEKYAIEKWNKRAPINETNTCKWVAWKHNDDFDEERYYPKCEGGFSFRTGIPNFCPNCGKPITLCEAD